MKDSAILKDIISIHYGKSLIKSSRNESGPYSVYGSNGEVGKHDQFLINKPTLIIGRKGSVGHITFAASGGWVIDTAFYTVPKVKLDHRFLYYALRVSNLHEKTITTSIPGINRDGIYSTKIYFPPLAEQKRIAAILDKADALRTKRQQAITLLDEFLKSTFLEMFGDPVKNIKRYPEKYIGELSSLVSSGSTPLGGQKVYETVGTLFIRSQNVLMNKLDLSDAVYINQETHQSMRRTWLKNGDVLLNITGASIGRVSFFDGQDNSANVNQHVCIIRVQHDKTCPEFLSYFLSFPNYQKSIMSMNAGATRQAFNFEQIKKFKVFLPAIQEQHKFSRIYHYVKQLHQKMQKSQTELDRQFNALMQRAFRGEL